MEEHRETHPSYCQVSFHRIHAGGGVNLYGSSLKHSEVIRMTVYESETSRDLHETQYFAHKALFEIDMSPQQFAECITSLNMGRGTPATLVRMLGKKVEECPHESERELFTKEFKESTDEVLSAARQLISEAREILSQKGSIKVADRKKLLGLLGKISQEVGSNLPFIDQMFQEAMDKSVNAGKHEIESFWRGIVEQLGVQALAEKAERPLLLGEEVSPSIDIEKID